MECFQCYEQTLQTYAKVCRNLNFLLSYENYVMYLLGDNLVNFTTSEAEYSISVLNQNIQQVWAELCLGVINVHFSFQLDFQRGFWCTILNKWIVNCIFYNYFPLIWIFNWIFGGIYQNKTYFIQMDSFLLNI